MTPQEWADTTSDRFREAWELLDITNDDFIRTTEPRHRVGGPGVPAAGLRQRRHRARHLRGPLLRRLRGVLHRGRARRGAVPDPRHRPVEPVTEENYFFRLSKFEQPLLDYYAAHPEAVQPESKRNEVLGFIRQGLRDFSMSRTSISWGIPLPWDPAHVTYVWYDALDQLRHRGGVRRGSRAVRVPLAGPVPPHRQGHPALPRRLLARDADGGRRCRCPRRCSPTGTCSSAARR